jgi:hypothetical protein
MASFAFARAVWETCFLAGANGRVGGTVRLGRWLGPRSNNNVCHVDLMTDDA